MSIPSCSLYKKKKKKKKKKNWKEGARYWDKAANSFGTASELSRSILRLTGSLPCWPC